MTRTANDHTASLQAGTAKAIRVLRGRQGKLTQLDHLKLHSLLHNLRAMQAHATPPNGEAGSPRRHVITTTG